MQSSLARRGCPREPRGEVDGVEHRSEGLQGGAPSRRKSASGASRGAQLLQVVMTHYEKRVGGRTYMGVL
jgi:hypothetical protein